MKIEVSYDGAYPNLCSGHLIVYIDGFEWVFPDYCMNSGGYVRFDGDWNEEVELGPWSVDKWPVGFPEAMKLHVENAVNDQVPHGCCGGCV